MDGDETLMPDFLFPTGCAKSNLLARIGSWTTFVPLRTQAVMDRGFPAFQWDLLLDAHGERRMA